MKITLSKRIGLLAFLLPCALALSTTVHAETNKLVIESGDSAQKPPARRYGKRAME